MWTTIKKHLENYPERLKVARILVENGLSVKNGRIYLNEIEIPRSRIAKAAGVDRRTVNETIRTIRANKELRQIFEGLRSGWALLEGDRPPLRSGRCGNNAR
jgi:predicted regulator of amino acid metabolism with ACT domain